MNSKGYTNIPLVWEAQKDARPTAVRWHRKENETR
jgi:hypothetical protein